jgi:hypothetical protein
MKKMLSTSKEIMTHIQYTNKNPNNAFVFNFPCVRQLSIFANKGSFTTVVVFS